VPWLIRTDFTDRQAWNAVCSAAALDISASDDPSPDQIFAVVDDPEFDRLTPEGLLALEPCETETFFVVDSVTMSHPEQPILAIDVNDEPGRSFRLVPAQVRAFSENMLIGNMDFADFADFADGIDEDGIFRGFDKGPWPPATPTVDAPTADTAVSAEEEGGKAANDDTIAPTITLAFGQRWPGDSVSQPPDEIRLMVWDSEPPPETSDGTDRPPN